ncbi:MAG: type II secretion system F family protein [Bdellovibrionales bacterium]|nr:type II secretion system F family protein [Bdellovibrionales bacterium]
MALFRYQARSISGSAVEGQIEANNETEARVKIRANKLIPIKVEAGGGGAVGGRKTQFSFSTASKKVKSKELQVFTRQLAVLIAAGVPIVPSLDALSKGSKSPALKNAILKVTEDISAGKKMGEAFGKQPHIFDKFYVNMIVAGEEGGVLEIVLRRLADYIEKLVKIQAKIKGALVYPIAILVISMVVVGGLLVFVIPKFAELFTSSGMKLPALTQFVMNMSEFLQSYWWMILIGIGTVIFAVKQYYNTTTGKETIDILLVKVPVFGDLIVKGGLAKFTRTLSTLLTAGVPIMDAMDIAGQVSGNTVLERAIFRARDSIASGKSIAVPFAQEKIIPTLVVQMMAVGEQTGGLDEMLSKVADFFEDEVDGTVAAMTSLMEPVLIVVLGGIVAFLVLAMYLPIFQMAGGASNG